MSPVKASLVTAAGRFAGPALLASAGVLVLAGCGAGQEGTIGQQVAAVNGATADVGDVSVNDVVVGFPPGEESFWAAGETAPLQFTVSNNGRTADELVSITSPAASEVEIVGSTDLPGDFALRAPELDEDSASPTEPDLGYLVVALTDLTTDVRPGLTIDVTFTFSEAGELTVPVPVAAPDSAQDAPGSDQ